jgi:hypothetical protein
MEKYLEKFICLGKVTIFYKIEIGLSINKLLFSTSGLSSFFCYAVTS